MNLSLMLVIFLTPFFIKSAVIEDEVVPLDQKSQAILFFINHKNPEDKPMLNSLWHALNTVQVPIITTGNILGALEPTQGRLAYFSDNFKKEQEAILEKSPNNQMALDNLFWLSLAKAPSFIEKSWKIYTILG